MTAVITKSMIASTLLLWCSCQNTAGTISGNDTKIANVGSQTLYKSELDQITSLASESADSSAIANGYVEQWIRRAVLISEAERSLSNTIDIDRLVEDYRSSLLINNYEQHYVSTKLDTTVTPDQLAEVYEQQKDNFALAADLYQLNIATVDAKAKGLEGFFRAWKSSKREAVKSYVEENALTYVLNESWYSKEALATYVPDNLFKKSSYKKGAILQKNQDGIEYFVKVLDVADKGKAPPFAYVKEKMVEIILQKRKKELLQKLESDLYRQALSTNKIRVYKD